MCVRLGHAVQTGAGFLFFILKFNVVSEGPRWVVCMFAYISLHNSSLALFLNAALARCGASLLTYVLDMNPQLLL